MKNKERMTREERVKTYIEQANRMIKQYATAEQGTYNDHIYTACKESYFIAKIKLKKLGLEIEDFDNAVKNYKKLKP